MAASAVLDGCGYGLKAARPFTPSSVDVGLGAPYKSASGANAVTLRLDEYFPVSRAPRAGRPAIVFVHGADGPGTGPGDLASLATAAARAGFASFSVDYRLTPPALPTAVSDVQSAIRWVRDNAGSLQVDPRRVAIWGVSQGATVALDAALAGRGSLDRGARVRAAVGWSGVYDLAGANLPIDLTTGLAQSLDCAPRRCGGRAEALSPVSKADPTDPPVFLVGSSAEAVPVSQMGSLARRLRRVGVPAETLVVPGTCHGSEYAAEATAPTLDFLRHTLRGPSAPSRLEERTASCRKAWW